jgi:hypothetical protein
MLFERVAACFVCRTRRFRQDYDHQDVERGSLVESKANVGRNRELFSCHQGAKVSRAIPHNIVKELMNASCKVIRYRYHLLHRRESSSPGLARCRDPRQDDPGARRPSLKFCFNHGAQTMCYVPDVCKPDDAVRAICLNLLYRFPETDWGDFSKVDIPSE